MSSLNQAQLDPRNCTAVGVCVENLLAEIGITGNTADCLHQAPAFYTKTCQVVITKRCKRGRLPQQGESRTLSGVFVEAVGIADVRHKMVGANCYRDFTILFRVKGESVLESLMDGFNVDLDRRGA